MNKKLLGSYPIHSRWLRYKLHGPIALEFGAEVLIFKSSGIQEQRERCRPILPAADSRSGKSAKISNRRNENCEGNCSCRDLRCSERAVGPEWGPTNGPIRTAVAGNFLVFILVGRRNGGSLNVKPEFADVAGSVELSSRVAEDTFHWRPLDRLKWTKDCGSIRPINRRSNHKCSAGRPSRG